MIRSTMSPAQVAAIARKVVGQVVRHAEAKHATLLRQCPPPDSKELLVRSGHCTTTKGIQWIYVVTATQGRTTIYPLLWYATTQGVCAMQVDAQGPASFFQAHVMDRYLQRYLRGGDLMNALREFHLRNYAKTFLPDDNKNDRLNYVATSDDGYVAGELQREKAVVYFRTFYDERAGKRRFGEFRAALDWQVVWHKVRLARMPRRDTPHIAWGRGYDLKLAA